MLMVAQMVSHQFGSTEILSFELLDCSMGPTVAEIVAERSAGSASTLVLQRRLLQVYFLKLAKGNGSGLNLVAGSRSARRCQSL